MGCTKEVLAMKGTSHCPAGMAVVHSKRATAMPGWPPAQLSMPFVQGGTAQRSFSVVRMPLRPMYAGFHLGTALLGMLIILALAPVAMGQCPPPPDPPGCWIECGNCRGDLNADGLLNDLDLLVFEIYQEQDPQNPCANFNGDCDVLGFPIVNAFDRQILNCIINESDGACSPECGATTRDCLVAAQPRNPDRGGCNNATCCNAVCIERPLCCEVLWDELCVDAALNICYPNGPVTRPDAGDCLCEHNYDLPQADCIELTSPLLPGCSDKDCNDLVCACDPTCCTVAWDQDCIAAAGKYCTKACTNIILQDLVCADDTFAYCCETGTWDAGCILMAAQIIINQPGLQIRSFPRNCLLCPVTDAFPTLSCEQPGFRSLLCQIDPAYCGDAAFDTDVQSCVNTVLINFEECQLDWDEGCAQIAARLCRWPGTSGLGNCLLASDINNGGCNDSYCTSIVCACDPNCCEVSWDQQCVDLAGTHCVLVPSRDLAVPDLILPGGASIEGPFGLQCGGDTTSSCFYQNFSPFCDDAACCQLVCGYDRFCCDNRWDTLCAKLATAACDSVGVGICGPVVAAPVGDYPPPTGPSYRSCFEERPAEFCAGYPNCSPAGCDNAECCNNVCYVDPYCCEIRWDQICADGADILCPENFPECGFVLNGSCFIPHKKPFCDDGRCCENVCNIEPTCCELEWDELCVETAERNCTQCGDVYAGSCLVAHPAPACYDEECCQSVCKTDPFCCTITWDAGCANIALSNPEQCGRTDACGDPLARGCYISSYLPGCSDDLCCREICKGFDPWCCEVRWDAVCATQALTLCEPPFLIDGRDPCDQVSGNPGCNVPECSAAVCSVPGYESCCTQRWDTFCVEAADWLCTGIYECPGSGDCLRTNSTPLCDDAACCNAVCTYDPLCCRDVWDNGCVLTAVEICITPSNEPDWNCPCLGSCFEARSEDDPTPGCNDESCCSAVCRVNPDCCIIAWDQQCADLAVQFCGGGYQCGSWTSGDCLRAGDTPFCNDPACCEAVCTIEPFCCSNAWDSFCVGYAVDRCRRGCGLSTSGSCYFPHLTPGCDDSECCKTVCEEDPICCSVSWDGFCSKEALDLCEPPECGEFSAGDCCIENLSPACNNKRCCDAVCEQDPVCCDFSWDFACVDLARQDTTNCGCSFDCGDPCSGSCCIANFTPSCDNEECCSAICKIDPFCCETIWDFSCAGAANFESICTDPFRNPDAACPIPQCGEPGAGSCCFPNGTPNCDDEDCCTLVCNSDPSCCDVAWDSVCAQSAEKNCNICTDSYSCGDPEAGDCCEEHSNPFCDDFNCCQQVCALDELCCIGTWDELCVALAIQNCVDCSGGFAPPKSKNPPGK